ncbi:extracellular tyrosine-protein kinase PKDCC-like [Trachemys scripta elegans]|uniref:extracellular tyrosine-protein kinase PKDCC-like n=1 Tax=Trachemys scripta elegans TaxID=31138 RepID=UPI001551D008|nr:extracellular tyrosine-protein kinase PKDCC-like [Trachemys scripta elegans]
MRAARGKEGASLARPRGAALLGLLAASALLALALPSFPGAGPCWGANGTRGCPRPARRPPPALLDELSRRQRDLLRLATSAGDTELGLSRGGRLGCGDLSRVTELGVVGSGFTKLVLRAALPGTGAIALKSVHRGGSDVSRCVQRYGHPAGCHRLASYKLLKEVTLLQRLDHPGVVKLHGQCYDNSLDPEIRVIAMLELGSPLEMIQLLQTPWEERFKICLSLVKLLFYLAHSPLGSIVLLDFQPRQFVMVDGNLKVTDMDDASTEELSCKEDNDCTLDFPGKSFILKCTAAGKCDGLNEKKNLFNAYRYFFTYLLPHTAPSALRPLLGDILNATGDLRYGINETLGAFEKVLHLYKSGLYLQKRLPLLKEYITLKGFRTMEMHDYKCWPSYSHLGCLLSIYNAEEAAAICNSQPQCQSFIVTQQRTWTGRPLASFRSSLTDLIPDVNAVLYIKRSAPSRERL